MTDDDKARERILREGQAMTIYVRLTQHGPQTVNRVIDAGLVNNADDAIAAMARLVKDGTAQWTEVDGMKAIKLP